MQSITVYCASSTALDPEFHEPARQIGQLLVERNLRLIYGGGRVGLMGEVARAVRAGGGHVTGIITHTLVGLEQADDACDELVVVDTMRERKRLLAERGDAFLALPGGLGTYEELFEVLVGRQLGEHTKPIGIVNINGYYDPLIELIDHGIEHRFIRPAMHDLFTIHEDPATVIDHLLDPPDVCVDHSFLPTSERGG